MPETTELQNSPSFVSKDIGSNLPEAFLQRKKIILEKEKSIKYEEEMDQLFRLNKLKKIYTSLKYFEDNQAVLDDGRVFKMLVAHESSIQGTLLYGVFQSSSESKESAIILFCVTIMANEQYWVDAIYHLEPAWAEDLESLIDVLNLRMADIVTDILGPINLNESSDPSASISEESALEDEIILSLLGETTSEAKLPAEIITGTLGSIHLTATIPLSKNELTNHLQEYISYQKETMVFEILPADEYFFSTDPHDPEAKLKAFRLLLWVQGTLSKANLEGILLDAITGGYVPLENAETNETVELVFSPKQSFQSQLKALVDKLKS